MSNLVFLPIFIPLATAIGCLFGLRWVRFQMVCSLLGGVLLLGSAVELWLTVKARGIQLTQVGDWSAPFGITLVADSLSATLVLASAVLGLLVLIYSFANIDTLRQRHGYFIFYNVLLVGVCGAFLTGDLFNLYVFFEVMLIASFVLLALGGERNQLEGGVKYVTMNLVASALFLAGLGMLYGKIGTLNMADIAQRMMEPGQALQVRHSSLLFLAAFGIKAAVFPFFFWLPASYHTPPAAVSAIFSGLLTKVGIYALIRHTTLLFPQNSEFVAAWLFPVAGLTMLIGVLGAAAQNDIRRILSFHIVSQIGYMIMGVAIGTAWALTGTVYFVVHNMVVKTHLFLISGVVEKLKGTGQLKHLGGLYSRHVFLAVLFLLSAFSLAGIPPLSGFWSKMILIRSGFEAGAFILAATAFIVGLMTLFSMTKIWGAVFWGESPEPVLDGGGANRRLPAMFILPIVVLSIMALLMGLLVEPIVVWMQAVASELLDSSIYINAVQPGASS